MSLTQYELLQYIGHSLIEGDWLDVTRIYECTKVHIIHRFAQLTSFFTSLEATDSTSSLPYPSVLLQFVLEFTKVAKGLKLMALAEGISIRQ